MSAFAACKRLVLGQVAVAEKSNEIVANVKLLDMLVIEGAIVTIGAMAYQRTIARKVIDKKADHVLAPEGNRVSLQSDVQLFVAEQRMDNLKVTTIGEDNSAEGNLGRIDKLSHYCYSWPGIASGPS